MEALRVARAKAGLTIGQLAEKSGVSRHTISSIEHGSHKPHEVTLAKVAKALGRPVSEFLKEESTFPKEVIPPLLEIPSAKGKQRTQMYLSAWSDYVSAEADLWKTEISKIISNWEQKAVPEDAELAYEIGRARELRNWAIRIIDFETSVLWPNTQTEWQTTPPIREEIQQMARLNDAVARLRDLLRDVFLPALTSLQTE